MTTATTAFEGFLRNVRLPEDLAKQCRDEHVRLRALLLADADLRDIIVSTFLQGSYRRDTGTKPNGEDPHADVDVVVVTTLDPNRYTPDLVVARFTPFLERNYPDQWERQDRAIKITPAGKDVTLDLVVTAAPSKIQQEFFESVDPMFKAARTGAPASAPLNFREAFDRIAKSARLEEWQRDPLLIPSRDLGRWQRTHPLEQIRWTQQKNDDTNGHYINVVRTLKWWRKENPDGKYPKGYPLEHLVGDTCPDGIESVAEGLTLALEAIRDNFRVYVQAGLKPILSDRGVPEHDVLRKITPEQFATFWRLVETAAGKARAALNAEGNANSAILWRDLLGHEFPQPSADELKGSMAAALRSGSAGVVGGAIVSGGGRPLVPGRSHGGKHRWPRTRGRRPVGPRQPVELAERMRQLATLEEGMDEHYACKRVSTDLRLQAYVWRVPVTVPVYDERNILRIELDERRPVRVTAEGWEGPMRHTFGANRLCMWYSKDPPNRHWNRSDGLLKLVDTAVAHLFKELYFRETGEWLGEEVHPDAQEIERRLPVNRAA